MLSVWPTHMYSYGAEFLQTLLTYKQKWPHAKFFDFTLRYIGHSITDISMSIYILYILINLSLWILPKEEDLLHILIISSLFIQINDFKLFNGGKIPQLSNCQLPICQQ